MSPGLAPSLGGILGLTLFDSWGGEAGTVDIDKVRDRTAELPGQHVQDANRGIPQASLDLRKIPQGDALHFLLRETCKVTSLPDIGPHQFKKSLEFHSRSLPTCGTLIRATKVPCIMGRWSWQIPGQNTRGTER